MSQLGIPKMGQKSSDVRHEPATARCGHVLSPGRGDTLDVHPFDGSTGGTLRAHPGLARSQTHLDIVY